MKKKYYVSPRNYVTYGGRKMGAVGFDTIEGAKIFIRKRRLKGAILYKRK
jgi:hypothetical protein